MHEGFYTKEAKEAKIFVSRLDALDPPSLPLLPSVKSFPH